MSKAWLTYTHAMDSRLQGNTQPHHRLNGDDDHRTSRPSDGNMLPFLSQEEQECLQFFEDTIDSLEESLEEDEPRPVEVRPPSSSSGPGTDGPPVTSSLSSKAILSSPLARPPSPKEQDIIDLVCPEPDLVQTKEPITPIDPDFQSMLPSPDRHFEDKPRHEPADHLPSEYNPPLPSGSYDLTDGHPSYHPPGSIPTPVLIAQKIAENQTGGNSTLLSSSVLSRRSPESPISSSSSSSSADPPSKQGPPTSAKPTRFPANISVCLGHREHQNQPLANVNIQERRAQMLANLSGTSHPLLVEEPKENEEQKARNVPTRSISFRDPTPEKSRMEALSKLGLTRNRAMSGGTSLPSISVNPAADGETVHPSEASVPLATEAARVPVVNTPTPAQSHTYEDRKPETLQSDSVKSHQHRKPQLSPPPSENKAPAPPPPEVTSLEFNTYGGKSIVVIPSVVAKSEPASSPTSPEPPAPPSVLANPSEFNSYGGKSKVLTRVSAPATRSDLPDILSSHIDPYKSHTLPAKSELPPPELNSYGGKSRSINPSSGLHRPSTRSAQTLKPPAPTPAPRPARHSYHSTPPRAPRALSPDHKRRSNSMFRPQGITVQFSGRGATDESRREALRKLGLLKES